MPDSCYHCGEAIPGGFQANLTIKGENRAFCCYGCMAIAEMIVSDGLESFYQHRTAMAPKPDDFTSSQQDELRLYDDPELQAEFVTHEGERSEAHLSIGGITCAACIWLLEREITRTPGVSHFSVNHSSHKATLIWQQDTTPLSDVLIGIRKLGYKVSPYQEDQVRIEAKRERRNAIFRIAVAGIATMQNMMFSVPLYLGIYSGIDQEFLSLFRWVSMFMCAPVVFFAALPFFRAALRDLRTRHLTMDIPVSLAIGAAYVASCYITIFTEPSLESDVYFDSVSMFTFFLLLGRFMEMQTRHSHLNSDAEMEQLLPATAIRQTEGGEESVPAHRIEIGDLLVVKQGQVAPADGIVVEGESRFDESALTGEYLPVFKRPDDTVSGGTANIENTLVIRATATPKQSRVAAIMRLLDQAGRDKPRTALIADHVASYFVAFVLLATTLTGLFWAINDPENVFAVVLSVLVVTCPCALSLATPTALTAANTALRQTGFLIARGHTLEALNSTSDVIFDKTGTLTQGKLEIHQIKLFQNTLEAHALAIAAALESHSSHPIAQAFKPHFSLPATKVQTVLGRGINGVVHHRQYWLGTLDYVLEAQGNQGDVSADKLSSPHPGQSIYLSNGEHIIAQFLMSDALRDEARECVRALHRKGVHVHILSGDHEFSVRHTAMQLGIEQIRFSQTPEQKLSYVQQLQQKGHQVAMVGDGINDLPVLSGARVSIAMGAASDITKLNSDAILLNDHLSVLATAFDTAHRTRTIIKQNMGWAIGYNLTMLPLAAAGLIPPYFAALGMSLSSVLVVFNSIRLRKVRRPAES